ncbi:MAG: macro domain-containing protein [Verrucomicrobiia bacterium]|jgi:O-acetyl-ADP-ribose deacetylase (regulator of RNase III)
MQKRVGRSTLELVQGDITALQVDAIVNAANVHLQHGGGVAWAIVRKGGHEIQEESDAIIARRGPLETGDTVITSGGKLPARFVIHTAGPIWGDGDEDSKLRKSIRSSLELADEHGVKSIAFPAISTGIYRFPVDRAAKLMLDEAVKYLRGKTSIERVLFCLYDDATYDAFERAFEKL